MAIPTAVGAIQTASNKILRGTWTAQNNVDKTWIAIIVTETGQVEGFKLHDYKYERYSDGVSGSKIGSKIIGSDGWNSTTPASDGKYYKEAQAILTEYVTAKANNTIIDYVSTDTPSIMPNQENIYQRWNPPSHSSTRGPQFYLNAGLGPSQLSAIDAAKKYRTKIGRIYQTDSSAKALNRKASEESRNTYAYNNLLGGWGFRFCYNPSSIQYSTSMDSSIDWLQAPADPSKYFGGNMQINFDLYLNRISDMSALRKTDYNSGYPGQAITDEQREGILNRGTEYDLEYLYRVVNGNPKYGMNLLNQSTTQKTSDFGYITGMPLWLKFHDNMNLKASLSGLSVTHAIFTDDMVPMLSIVSLTLIRYPESNTTGAAGEALSSVFNIKTGAK